MAGNVIEQVKEELGAFGKDIAERMERQNEKVRELDAKLAQLGGNAGARVRSRYAAALAAGRPELMNADETVEQFTERMAAKTGGRKDPRGLRAVRMMRALARSVALNGNASLDGAIQVAKSWDDDETAGLLEEARDLQRGLGASDKLTRERAQRALGTTTLGSGAGFVQPELASEIVDFLHPMAVVRSSGVSTLPLSSGQLSMPYINTAATASYVGENSGPNATEPKEGRLNLSRKILAAIVPASKELLAESSYSVDEFLRMHLARVLAAREDLAFIRGDGTADTPRGMKYWAGLSSGGGSAHVFNRTLATGAVTIDTITADALKAMRLVEDSNVPMVNAGWILPVREVYGLMSKRNATTQMEIWPELRSGTWYGFPFKKTTQIPKNLAGDASGTGTGNKSEVYFAAFSHLVIAESEGLEINAFDGGAYKDSSGNVQSGITNREVVIQATAKHDFGATFRGDEVCCIESVDWGA